MYCSSHQVYGTVTAAIKNILYSSCDNDFVMSVFIYRTMVEGGGGEKEGQKKRRRKRNEKEEEQEQGWAGRGGEEEEGRGAGGGGEREKEKDGEGEMNSFSLVVKSPFIQLFSIGGQITLW